MLSLYIVKLIRNVIYKTNVKLDINIDILLIYYI